MRKARVLILALMILCFTMLFNPSLAAETGGVCGENAFWSMDDDGVLTITGTGEISSSPWAEDNVKRVEIEQGITGIDSMTFAYCFSLTNISIPDSVTRIGEMAFYECERLTDINIPDGVTIIESETFAYCSSLKSITIPDGIKEIGYGAFYGCDSLAGINIPDNVADIGENAFAGCKNLTIIRIMDDHPYFMMQDGVLFSRDGARLVLYLRDNPLTEYRIPSGVKTVDDGAFDFAENLVKLIVSEGVEHLGNSYDINNLRELIIPSTLVDDEWWYGVSKGVSQLSISEENPVWKVENGFLINKTNGKLVYYVEQMNPSASLTVPDSVHIIGSFAFNNCWKLNVLYIPDSVTTIEYIAFENCPALQRISVPKTVIEIEEQELQSTTVIFCNAGSRAEQWAQLNHYPIVLLDDGTWKENSGMFLLPKGMKTIGEEAFRNTSADCYYIPYGTTEIGSKAFADLAKQDVRIVIPATVISIADDAFENSDVHLVVTFEWDDWVMDDDGITWQPLLYKWLYEHGFDCELMNSFLGNG